MTSIWIKKILMFLLLVNYSFAQDSKQDSQAVKASPFLTEQSFRSLNDEDRTIYLLTLVHLAYILENLQTLPKESIIPNNFSHSKRHKNASWPFLYSMNLNQAEANPVLIVIEAGVIVIKVARALSPILLKSFSRLAQFIKSSKTSKIIVETAGGVAIFEGASWIYRESNKELPGEEPNTAKESFSCLYGGHPSKLVIKDKQPICERPASSKGPPCTKEQFKCFTFGLMENQGSKDSSFCVNSNVKNIAQQCAKTLVDYLETSSKKQNKSKVIRINGQNYNEFTANLTLMLEDIQDPKKMQSSLHSDNISLLTYCKEFKKKTSIDMEQQEECVLVEDIFSSLKKMESDSSSEIRNTSKQESTLPSHK